MAKQTEQKTISQGICRFCQGEFAKNKMTQHLKSCKARFARAAEQEGNSQRLFHILVEGKYRPEYWMHLELPAAATLEELDDFLRAVWLECCGHLSEFEIDDITYSSLSEDEWDMGMNFGGLALVGNNEEEGEEEEEEDEEDLPDMEEIATEMSRQLSAEFHADLKDVPVEQIEEKLEKLFTENMPPGLSTATLPALRPLLNSMALSLQQGTLAQDLEAAEEEEAEGGMDAELGEVLNVGEKFSYVYDFGSSTTLSLRVIAEREGVLPLDEDEDEEALEVAEEFEDEEDEEDEEEIGIVVMARNEPPTLVCHICGQPATFVPSSSEYASLALEALCETHAKESEASEELLPIVNSPRVGICGYTGDADVEEWDEEDEEE